jgi:hypothetical protein
MNAQTILDEIRPLGTEGYRKILLNHGAQESCYGVKIADLKKIQKRIKKDYRLALDLFETGVYDAQYLAGLIADDAQMTKKDLQRWMTEASPPIAGVTVATVAAGSPNGWALGLEWIDSMEERIAAAGWAALSSIVSVKDDAELDLPAIKKLLQRVQKTIHDAPDDVRYQMNGFVIATGCFISGLTDVAKQAAGKIGHVQVDMGNTACEVPFAPDYIKKVEDRGAIGKKRKSVKC